jgi:hypothetical protein
MELSMDTKPTCILSLVSILIELKDKFVELDKYLKNLDNHEEQDKYLMVHIEQWIAKADEELNRKLKPKGRSSTLKLLKSGLVILQFIEGVPQGAMTKDLDLEE